MSAPDLIIIKRWTWQQFTALAISVLLLLLAFVVSGYIYGVSNAINLYEKNEKLTIKIGELTIEQEETSRQLVMQKQISKVDQAANYHAGHSLDLQLQEIRDLERELKFFRSIMAPEESQKGLQIARFSSQQVDSGTFSWQLSLIQAGSQGRTLSGYVKVYLVAMRGNEKILLPLMDQNNKDKFNYRFKYFQHLAGTIQIAKDLVPIAVDVVAKSATSGQRPIEKQFPWQIDQEKLANVE